MFFFNPLEQFDIIIFFHLFNSNISITNITIMSFINLSIICILFTFYKQSIFKNNLIYIINSLFFFIKSILKDSISLLNYSVILLLFYLFIFLLLSNLIGMIPYSITITSHLIVTLYISLSFFIGTNLIGLLYHKETFFVLFLPEGIPLFIIPSLILIEYISYFSKIFSLAIRLFANMMSGHILLKILIGFSWSLISLNVTITFLSLISFFIVFLVIGLEFAIAFLQAYVFTILLIIYLNDTINTH